VLLKCFDVVPLRFTLLYLAKIPILTTLATTFIQTVILNCWIQTVFLIRVAIHSSKNLWYGTQKVVLYPFQLLI